MPTDAFRLLDLPGEILLIIGEQLPSEKDLNAFHQANRRLYQTLNSYLYRSNAFHHQGHALFWALAHEESGTARKSILAGTSSQKSPPWPFNWSSGRFSRQYIHTRHLASPTGWIEEPLFVACRQRKPKMIQCLLELGAHSKYQPERMLYLAAASGWPEVVRVLLEHGVHVDPGYVEITPLALAMMNGQMGIVDILLRFGADMGVWGCYSDGLSCSSALGSGDVRMGIVS